jgi:hypothetical protein
VVTNTDFEKKEPVASVMELSDEEAEEMLADSRWKWEMDQAAREKYSKIEGRAEGLEEGRKEAEAKYRPLLEAKDRELEELRRKLREAGIDS